MRVRTYTIEEIERKLIQPLYDAAASISQHPMVKLNIHNNNSWVTVALHIDPKGPEAEALKKWAQVHQTYYMTPSAGTHEVEIGFNNAGLDQDSFKNLTISREEKTHTRLINNRRTGLTDVMLLDENCFNNMAGLANSLALCIATELGAIRAVGSVKDAGILEIARTESTAVKAEAGHGAVPPA